MKAVIAIHGGAGTISRASLTDTQEKLYREALDHVLAGGQQVLEKGGSALDAVTEAVFRLEECPLFNAGKGAVFTHEGTHELDASIMDGRTLAAGAVACVQTIRNPIRAARAVMDDGRHVLLVGEGAETFAAGAGLVPVAQSYFYTPARHAQWQLALALDKGTVLDHDGQSLLFAAPLDPEKKMGTVGAVALDCAGNLAAATSTGGMTNKRVGRVGDTPLVGAGCYANNTVAVSCTGSGEMFIRTLAAYDVSALVEYRGLSLEEACRVVVMDKLPAIDGRGGLIAIDRHGEVCMPFNTEGMYRGSARAGGPREVAIHG